MGRPSSAPRSGRRSRPQSAQSRGGGEGSSGLFASSSAPDTRENFVASSAPTVAQFLPGDVKVSTCVRAKVSTCDATRPGERAAGTDEKDGEGSSGLFASASAPTVAQLFPGGAKVPTRVRTRPGERAVCTDEKETATKLGSPSRWHRKPRHEHQKSTDTCSRPVGCGAAAARRFPRSRSMPYRP